MEKNETKAKEGKMSQLMETFKEWLSSSSCHGFPRALDNSGSKFLFILWIIFPICAAGGAIYFISSTVSSYLDYDVVTNINVYNENSALFPSVSICNQNPFVTDYAINYVENAVSTLGLDMVYTSPSAFLEKIEFTRNVLQSRLKLESTDFKKKFALPFNQTVVSCIYNGKECADDDFDWYFDFNYGNCYRFNAGKNKPLKYSNQQGKFNGLTIEYFLGAPSITYPIITGTGVRLFLHNSTESPMPSQGIDIPPGKATSIAVNKMFVYDLGMPYNDCLPNLITLDDFDSLFYNTITGMGVRYSKSCCMDLCFQSEVAKKCGCYYANYAKLSNSYPVCSSPVQIDCVLKTFKTHYDAPTFPEYCQVACPQECESRRIFPSLSSIDFPTDYYGNLVLNNSFIKDFRPNMTVPELRQQIASFSVYYDELKYTKVVQIAKMGIADLFSAFGGNLGLFLGLSICSFMETFELIWKLIVKLRSKDTSKVQHITVQPFDE